MLTEEPVNVDAWWAHQISKVTRRLEVLRPSEWAERNRYLPAASSPRPGPYRYKAAPFLREIIDCLSVDAPVREVSFMKGVQIGATVGVLENYFGYLIGFVKKSPVMLLTADAELAANRFNTSIIPMLQLSGLDQYVRSHDERNARKTGRTEKRVEWDGGGWALLDGAKNPDKLRSFPIEVLLRDEVDAYAKTVGKDGDPMKLSADRTSAYERTRKILDISTPTIRGESNIESRFLAGDRRRFFVRCLKCNAAQTLRWRRTNKETGEVTGFTWGMTAEGMLVPDSVRYLCKACGHPHAENDKPALLATGEWRPTVVPANPHHRSYHLSALYSLFQTWGTAVAKWLEAWDPARNQPRDIAKLQVFYNNQLGEPFKRLGRSVRFESVAGHKRDAYHYGQIPNRWAAEHCGSPVLLVTCSVDVHGDNLAVATFGWCREGRALLLDYERHEGDTERLDEKATWGKLREHIEKKRYVADDGKSYPIALTFVDSGFRTDDVYRFCKRYASGVYPVKGRDGHRGQNIREWSEFKTPSGTIGYTINVDFFKDRWSAALKLDWDGQGLQPDGLFNAPLNARDEQLRELTVETKRDKIDEQTGRFLGAVWHRPHGAANELWDCLVYSSAGFDMLAWNVSVRQLGYEQTHWAAFFDACLRQHLFFTPADGRS
jgi:phage terminase large subunit GpA-like protein